MAAREVSHRTLERGFTLLELMTVVGVVAILAALAGSAISESRRVGRVSAEARLLVQRLQSVRTKAVSQGNAQGYGIGPNGIAATGTDAHQGFVFIKQNPVASPVTYDAINDRIDQRDQLPRLEDNTLVTIRGNGGTQPGPFQIGFDIDGQATVSPAAAFPYCIQISDSASTAIQRWVILFNDGTVKVQNNDTTGAYCP